MSAMYPSLEDMKVDHVQKAQMNAAESVLRQQEQQKSYGSYGMPQYPSIVGGDAAPVSSFQSAYPSLMEEYMGLKLEPPTGPIAVNQPSQVAVPQTLSGPSGAVMVAPLSGNDLGLRRALVSHGIREVILCKNQDGKIGLRLKDINKGIFVQFVMKDSPAALAGLRLGDQILQVNGENLAGYTTEKAMGVLKKAEGSCITLAVRDRPFERTITLHKDSTGHVGFTYKEGKITALVKDSSAARNGLLTEHQVLEVNGQNVIGIKDSEMGDVFAKAGQIITLTIMPSYVYDHMMKFMADSLIKKFMDHSVPDV